MYMIHTTITHLRLRMLANALKQFIASNNAVSEREEAIAMLAEIDARRALPDGHPEALVFSKENEGEK